MALQQKKRKKEEAYHWKASASSGHTTNLKQSILRVSISMVTPPKVAKESKEADITTQYFGHYHIQTLPV
jgi:hypothetical protein